MRKLQNTLYVTTPMAYLSLDGETIVIQNEDECLGRVPLLNLENIVSFGYRGASPRLMGACAERGIGLCFLTQHGRFLARISGPVSGNVLLRTAQYRIASTEDGALPIAKMFLTGKIFNGRWSLERTLRDHALRVDADRLKGAIGQMKQALDDLMNAVSIEELMGMEGIAAKAYFSVFDQMILKNSAYFRFDGRNRRPPLDPVNALLSFTYSILGHEIAGALGSKLAQPDKEVYALVGDGSFMMLNSEIPTAIQENAKITVVVFDNAAFGCINNLQVGHGNATLCTELRYRSKDGLFGDFLNIDYAKVAEGYGCKSYSIRTMEELAAAFEDAKKVKDRPVLFDIKVLPKTMTPGFESWWRVGVAEVSKSETVAAAYADMQANIAKTFDY